MRQHIRSLLCLLVAGVACGTPNYDIVNGDILVPRARRKAYIQGSTDIERVSLWPGGRVRYFVEASFPRDDARILAAIREFEQKTCIRFQMCPHEASCAMPYVRISEQTGKLYGGTATIGALPSSEGFVTLQLGCSLRDVIHEFAHTVGLIHEHERWDRDEYIRTGLNKNTQAKGIGPYDYASITHYPTEIVSPYPIGVKSELSYGDMSAIDFMYNGCSESYTAPTCIASVRLGETHMIPHSREWLMSFTAKYATPMSVTHTDDVPGDSVSYSSHVEQDPDVRSEEVRFTPGTAHAGKTYTISATFTADGVSTTCAVQVRVADPDTMCFGLEDLDPHVCSGHEEETQTTCFGITASDPGVCSGHGKCTTNPDSPCVCDAGYNGMDCRMFLKAPPSTNFTFDQGMGTWISQFTSFVTTEPDAIGKGSLQVGKAGESGSAGVDLPEVIQPSRITFYMTALGESGPDLGFYHANPGYHCFFVHRQQGMWSMDHYENSAVVFKPGMFHFVVLDLDWARQQVTLTVNDEVVGTSPIQKVCSAGIKVMIFSGYGLLDEVKMFANSPPSPTFTFDQGMGTWVPQFMSGVVTDFSAAGGRSLRVGKVGSHDVGVAHVTLQEASRPRYITLRMAPMAGSVPTFLSFRDAEDRNKDCFYLGRRLDTWSVNGVKEFDFNPGVFHFVELDVDWVGKQVTLTVDRQVVGTSGFHSDCITGMGTMALFGGAWLDEVQMWSAKPSL